MLARVRCFVLALIAALGVPVMSGCSTFGATPADTSGSSDGGGPADASSASSVDAAAADGAIPTLPDGGKLRFCDQPRSGKVVIFCEDFDGDQASPIGGFEGQSLLGGGHIERALGKGADGTQGLAVGIAATAGSANTWVRSAIRVLQSQTYELTYSVAVVLGPKRSSAVLGGLIRQTQYERYGSSLHLGAVLSHANGSLPSTPIVTPWNNVSVRLTPNGFPVFKRDVIVNSESMESGVNTDLQAEHRVEVRIGLYDTSLEAAAVEVIFDNVLFVQL